MVHHCVEREKYLQSMSAKETKLNNELAEFAAPPPEVQALLDEIDLAKAQILALEEQISAVNNTSASLSERYEELENSEPIESAERVLIMFRSFEQMDKLRINIEAQLFLNLR